MNQIQIALDSLYKTARKFTDVDLLLSMPGQAPFPIKGTVASVKSTLDPNQTKVQSSRHTVLLDYEEFKATHLPVVRGLLIQVVSSGAVYEVVIDNKGLAEFNDPNQHRIVLNTVLKDCKC